MDIRPEGTRPHHQHHPQNEKTHLFRIIEFELALGETGKRCIFKLVRCKFCYEIIGRVISFFSKPNDPERNKKQKKCKN